MRNSERVVSVTVSRAQNIPNSLSPSLPIIYRCLRGRCARFVLMRHVCCDDLFTDERLQVRSAVLTLALVCVWDSLGGVSDLHLQVTAPEVGSPVPIYRDQFFRDGVTYLHLAIHTPHPHSQALTSSFNVLLIIIRCLTLGMTQHVYALGTVGTESAV